MYREEDVAYEGYEGEDGIMRWRKRVLMTKRVGEREGTKI
jgi:hypothetical protein